MRYEEDFKKQLVKEYFDGGKAIDICFKHNISKSTFYTWVKLYKEHIEEESIGINLSELKKIKRQLKRLKEVIEVLQNASCTASAPLKEKLYALEKLHGQYSVRVLCDALDVDRGTFYNHIYRNKKNNSTYQARRDELSKQIKDIFDESKQIFGAKKIKAILGERGIKTSDKMVSELMYQMNLESIRTNSKKIFLQKEKNRKKKDLVRMRFSVNKPNDVWVSDITSFYLNKKTYYICAILDLYSRKVIAFKISEKQSTQLVTSTFKIAYKTRNVNEGLIFHSDRGTQYTAHNFQDLIRSLGIKQSFSPTGSPYHNSVMESFFSTLKKEELYRTAYHSVSEFKDSIKIYMNFYNVGRPHSTLNYKTPDAHEAKFYKLLEEV